MEKIIWIYLAILAVGVVIGMIKAIKKERALRKELKEQNGKEEQDENENE